MRKSKSEYQPPDWPRCHWCNARPDIDELEIVMTALKNCNNCSADIKMGGQWSGYGKEAIVELFSRFGYDAVNDSWMRGKDAKQLD
jgi:uncharacterized paraquat-inducible protein A